MSWLTNLQEGATGWPLVHAIAIVVGAWFLGKWLRRVVTGLPDGAVNPTIRAFLASASMPLVLLLAAPSALDAMGVSITSFVALLSTAGLAIAVGLKDSLSNIASGAVLLTTQAFGEGDVVTLAGVTGKVRRIRLLTTELDTADGRRVNITNDKVLSMPIERHAANGTLRVEVVVRAPVALVDEAFLARLAACVGEVPGCAPAPDVVVLVDFEREVASPTTLILAKIALRAVVDATDANTQRNALALAAQRMLDASTPPP